MVAQRGRGLSGPVARPEKAEGPEKRSVERAPPRRKLSFNEKRALETLPVRIDELRRDLEALERKLADADFAAREPAEFLNATKNYPELREALASAQDDWLGLEILREDRDSRRVEFAPLRWRWLQFFCRRRKAAARNDQTYRSMFRESNAWPTR